MEEDNQQVKVETRTSLTLLWCFGSFTLFHLTRLFLNKLVVPQIVRSQGRATTWKWVNTANSLFHSLVTGVGSLLCFYLHPNTATDVVSTYSTLSHGLTAFSVGYFVFDFFDMFLNHRKRSSYELMVHHTFVTSCFSVSMLTNFYLGFVMVALVVEVNSVFLHWRQLLLLSKVSKQSTYYREISLLNIFTFVAFRIVTLGWMTRWLALNKEKVPLSVYTLGSIAMAGIVCMNIVLFLRILKSDFHNSNSSSNSNSRRQNIEIEMRLEINNKKIQ